MNIKRNQLLYVMFTIVVIMLGLSSRKFAFCVTSFIK